MQRKPRILVAGSFVMDLIASTKHAPQSGQTLMGESFHMAPGGKGANQAVQCARLGAEVTMVGCVGGDIFAEKLLGATRESGVDVSHVKTDPTVCSGIGHVLLEVTETSAQNRITVISGANLSLTLKDVSWLKDAVSKYDMVLLQMEIPLEVNLQIARWARDAGVPVMLNPAPAAPLCPDLVACADYLTPNEQEAAAETGCPLHTDRDSVSEEEVLAAAKVLREKGGRNIIITLGRHGSAVVKEGTVRFVPRVDMPHVSDPTAAGDSFVAALAVGLCRGMTEEQALVFASHTAAITVSRMGAMPSLPTLEEVRLLLEDRKPENFDFSLL
jgi:ribokinase